MNLRISGIENEIELKDITIIEVMNKKFYSNILKIINYNCTETIDDKTIILKENDEILKMNKEIYLIFDLFNIDYNSKKILSKIYEKISCNIDKNEDYEIEENFAKIRKYLISEINELPFEFQMTDKIKNEDIFKLFELKIDAENYTKILERIELIIDLISTLNISSILMLVNLKTYLSKEELLVLYKYSMYNNIKLVDFESSSSEKLEYEEKYIIDNEFDEFKE